MPPFQPGDVSGEFTFLGRVILPVSRFFVCCTRRSARGIRKVKEFQWVALYQPVSVFEAVHAWVLGSEVVMPEKVFMGTSPAFME